MSDLFVRQMRYAGEKENFFTECVAGALRHDREFGRRFVSLLLEGRGHLSAGELQVAAIETQVLYAHSCVDMVVRLSDGTALGVEHKLWSPEGPGQLAKYLELPLEGIAFITAYEGSGPRQEVISHPKYLAPRSGRDHFVWQDLYPLIEECRRQPGAVLTEALGVLFRHLGFEPPPDTIPDLWPLDREAKRRNRLQFAKLWERTEAGLRGRGWRRMQRTSYAGLVYRSETSPRVATVWLDPVIIRGSLRVRLTPRSGTGSADLATRVGRATLPFAEHVVANEGRADRAHGREEVLDVLVSLRALLGGAVDAGSISERLASHVLSVIDAVS